MEGHGIVSSKATNNMAAVDVRRISTREADEVRRRRGGRSTSCDGKLSTLRIELRLVRGVDGKKLYYFYQHFLQVAEGWIRTSCLSM